MELQQTIVMVGSWPGGAVRTSGWLGKETLGLEEQANEVIAALQVDATDGQAKGIVYFLLHFLRWLSLRLNTAIAARVTSERDLYIFHDRGWFCVCAGEQRVYIDVH